MKNNNFYVYVYLDPRKPGDYNYGEYHFDYEPFYVGKGKKYRLNVHMCNSVNNNRMFKNKIKKIQVECNHEPIIIKYKENLSEQEALILESNIVKIIGRGDLKRGPLCNLTDGGEGVSGAKWKLTNETIKKRCGSNHWAYGKPMRDETKRKQRESHIGYKRSKESIEKQIKSMTGHIVSDNTRQKIAKSKIGIKRPEYVIKKISDSIKKLSPDIIKMRGDKIRKHSIEKLNVAVELRKHDMKYRDISKILMIPIGTLQKYCSKRIMYEKYI